MIRNRDVYSSSNDERVRRKTNRQYDYRTFFTYVSWPIVVLEGLLILFVMLTQLLYFKGKLLQYRDMFDNVDKYVVLVIAILAGIWAGLLIVGIVFEIIRYFKDRSKYLPNYFILQIFCILVLIAAVVLNIICLKNKWYVNNFTMFGATCGMTFAISFLLKMKEFTDEEAGFDQAIRWPIILTAFALITGVVYCIKGGVQPIAYMTNVVTYITNVTVINALTLSGVVGFIILYGVIYRFAKKDIFWENVAVRIIGLIALAMSIIIVVIGSRSGGVNMIFYGIMVLLLGVLALFWAIFVKGGSFYSTGLADMYTGERIRPAKKASRVKDEEEYDEEEEEEEEEVEEDEEE